MLLVFQDLTEIKRLENEVRIKEKLAAVGEMAAQLAHEIRNPLGSISGSAQVLMSEPGMSARPGAAARNHHERVAPSVRALCLGSCSRPNHPRLALSAVDLAPLVERAVALLRNGPEVLPTHSIRFEADEGPHVCLADRDRMTQVFWNLARNGLEAMPNGGELVVRSAPRGLEHRAVGGRRGPGDPRRRPKEALRAVPVRDASRHGARSCHRLSHRPGAPRGHLGVQPAGPGHGGPREDSSAGSRDEGRALQGRSAIYDGEMHT